MVVFLFNFYSYIQLLDIQEKNSFKILEIRHFGKMNPKRHKSHEKSPALAQFASLREVWTWDKVGGVAQEEPSGLPSLRMRD